MKTKTLILLMIIALSSCKKDTVEESCVELNVYDGISGQSINCSTISYARDSGYLIQIPVYDTVELQSNSLFCEGEMFKKNVTISQLMVNYEGHHSIWSYFITSYEFRDIGVLEFELTVYSTIPLKLFRCYINDEIKETYDTRRTNFRISELIVDSSELPFETKLLKLQVIPEDYQILTIYYIEEGTANLNMKEFEIATFSNESYKKTIVL